MSEPINASNEADTTNVLACEIKSLVEKIVIFAHGIRA